MTLKQTIRFVYRKLPYLSVLLIVLIPIYALWNKETFDIPKLDFLKTNNNDVTFTENFDNSLESLENISSSLHDLSFEKSEKQEKIRVEILAYKRGGSSFIGEIFNRNPTAWYTFEPMAFLMSQVIPADLRFNWDATENNPYKYLDKKFHYYTEYLAAVLNCSFSDTLVQYYQTGAGL